MPNWSGTVLTNKGLALQAKVEAGTAMSITKLKIGDGVLGPGQTVAALNDLVSPQEIVEISALSPLSNGTCKIHGIVTNTGIDTGFYVRELGVFAQDPDIGEILYAYTADGSPDFLPPEGGPVAVSEELVINLAFSNTANITASIAMDGLVTVAVMQNAVNVHNDDPTAHGNRYLQLAGGTMTGPLVLAADPTAGLQAATKQYADNNGGVNLRKNLHAYAVGDICYSKTAASYKYMQCTVAGTTAAAEPTWPDVGQTVADGTVTWVVRDIRAGEQIGSIKAWLATAAPPGWLALDTGAEVSRTTYPQLWQWVQQYAPLVTEAEWQAQAAVQSSVGFYSTGDGSTTFRLPRILDYGRGATAAEVGTWQEDAIRNITGRFTPIAYRDIDSHGAFVNETNARNQAGGTGSSQGSMPINFDASLVVPTADENRPKTIKFLYCVKAFDAAVNQGLISITELANEVAGKQQTIRYIKIADEKTSGANGGVFASGAWRTRSLNTVHYDELGSAALNNNQFTLAAGTYIFRAELPALSVNAHRGRLQDITDNITIANGTSENTNNSGDAIVTKSIVTGRLTSDGTQLFELQHYCATSYAGVDGFGAAVSIPETPEIYTTIELWRVN